MYLGGPKGELAVLRLFDPTTGKNKCTIRLEDKLARMFAFTFSADRRTLALATVQGVKLIETASGKEIDSFGDKEMRGASAIAFSKDGGKRPVHSRQN